jgi:cytochrome c-type biogenesis protein CcmH/NrfG
MKRRVALEIHRDDHKYDALGQVFLGAADRDETLRLLRVYLGPTVSLRHVEIDDDVILVEIDVREFPNESRNLVELGRSLLRQGRVKAAMGHLEEALRLAPLGADALKTLGRFHYRHRQRDAARRYLVRAREVAPADLEVLRLLAEIALHEKRPLEARSYLQRVLRVRPLDRRARAALSRLKPPQEPEEPRET